MQTIEVTDEQHAFVQRLREEISEQVVGKYGYVRERDAIQFLIDNLDGDLEVDADFDADSVGTEGVTAGIDGDADGEAVTFDESESELEPEEPVDADEYGGESDADEADGVGDEPDEGDEPDGDESDAGEAESDGAADDDDMLNEMMSLLDTHDDKWDEASSSDYRYSVELPDGTTEDVQTKDDVRALLFKHYR